MKSGDEGYLRDVAPGRVNYVPVKVNVVHEDGSVRFQQLYGVQTWKLNREEVEALFQLGPVPVW